MAKKLADESDGKYTEQQIEDQMALMNLTVDGKTYYGGNQVASGAKPQDGSDWTYYGQNQNGQAVWTQNVAPGNPDLQKYIAGNTQGSGLTYQPTTTGSNPGLVRAPDFVNFQIDYYVGSAWGTFTRDGHSFVGGGVNFMAPNPGQLSASVTLGYLNQRTVAPGQTDNFVSGYSGGGAVGYGMVGGGLMYSPGNGTATVFGVGAGWNTSKMDGQKGFDNVGGLSGGYSVNMGRIGSGW